MARLAISVITRNRAKHIREDLHFIAEAAQKKGIDIYIFDGSTDDSTKNAVYAYINKGYSNIKYLHYIDNWENGNIPERFIDAFMMPDTDYCWVCGDKFIVKPQNYDIVLELVEKDYDIITLYDKCFDGTRTFSNSSDFVDYCIVPLTHWGSTIIKKSLMNKIDIRQELVDNQSFWVVKSYVKAIDKVSFSGIALHINKSQFKIESKYVTRGGTEHTMWDTWIYNWCRLIDSFPEKYKSIRSGLYSRLDKEVSLFSLKELLRQRSTNQFDIDKVTQYQKEAKRVVLLPMGIVYLIAAIPGKIVKMIYIIVK